MKGVTYIQQMTEMEVEKGDGESGEVVVKGFFFNVYQAIEITMAENDGDICVPFKVYSRMIKFEVYYFSISDSRESEGC